jgi:hypothetical protein
VRITRFAGAVVAASQQSPSCFRWHFPAALTHPDGRTSVDLGRRAPASESTPHSHPTPRCATATSQPKRFCRATSPFPSPFPSPPRPSSFDLTAITTSCVTATSRYVPLMKHRPYVVFSVVIRKSNLHCFCSACVAGPNTQTQSLRTWQQEGTDMSTTALLSCRGSFRSPPFFLSSSFATAVLLEMIVASKSFPFE